MSTKVTYYGYINTDFYTKSVLKNVVLSGKWKVVTDTSETNHLKYYIEIEYDDDCIEYTEKKILWLFKYRTSKIVPCRKVMWIPENDIRFVEEQIFDCEDYEVVTDE